MSSFELLWRAFRNGSGKAKRGKVTRRTSCSFLIVRPRSASDGWASFRLEDFFGLLSSSDDISSTSSRAAGGAAFLLVFRLGDFLDSDVPLGGGSLSSEDKTIISLLGAFDDFFVPPLPEGSVRREA